MPIHFVKKKTIDTYIEWNSKLNNKHEKYFGIVKMFVILFLKMLLSICCPIDLSVCFQFSIA